jgi:hypothetical protein
MQQYRTAVFSFAAAFLLGKLNFAGAVTIEPNLVFDDVNVLVITDVHSWVAGHGRQEPKYDADYGDVLSFYEHLKNYLEEKGQDLWFVSNGDFVDGTGLSKTKDPSSLIPLLEKLPLDAANCGNHELYNDEVIQYMTRPGGWIDWWGERYVTGNIMLNNEEPQRPMGHHYRILKGKNSNLLVLGFLYNMRGASSLVNITKVENEVKSSWFQNLPTAEGEDKVDAILVLAHMDLVDPLVQVIRRALRDIVGDKMPIQFITGHTHYRGKKKLDDWSTSFEAGRYLDTVGFVSFPNKTSVSVGKEKNGDELFYSVFMDANKKVLAGHLGLDDGKQMQTHNGKDLTEFIGETRAKMGLLDEIGCAPQDYFSSAPLYDEQSLWRLYRDSVIPKTVFANGIMFLSHESWRYNLFSHQNLIVDDIVVVAPFNDTIIHLGMVPGRAILQLNATINKGHQHALPNYIMTGSVDDEEKMYDVYTHEFNEKDILKDLHKIIPDKTFSPENTEYSSTLLWLSFVRENWPCNDESYGFSSWVRRYLQ